MPVARRTDGRSGGIANSSRRFEAVRKKIRAVTLAVPEQFPPTGMVTAATGPIARWQPSPLARMAAIEAIPSSACDLVVVHGPGSDLDDRGFDGQYHGPQSERIDRHHD